MSIKPKLNLFDAIMIVVSLVVGIGIFRTPSMVASATGSAELFFTAWILGGIISLFAALTFAEIGSRFSVPGGYYKVVAECYSPSISFMFNWAAIIISGAGASNVAIIGAEYLNPIIFPLKYQTQTVIQFTAIGLILFLIIINYLGIKVGAWVQNILTVIKILMVLIIVFIALFFTNHSPTIINNHEIIHNSIFTALGVGFISVFYSYGGYQLTINLGGDISNPKKNIPLSIFTGIGIVIFLYLTVNFAYYKVLGIEGIINSKLVAAEIAKYCFGQNGIIIISLIIFLSALGFLNVTIMQTPRQWYSMAEDKVLPKIFKQINSKTQAQEFSLIFFSITSVVPIFFLGTFEKIVNYVMFTDSITIALTASTIFILRRRKEIFDGFKIPFYPILPIIPIIILVTISINVLLSNQEAGLFGTAILLIGYPIYKVMKIVN